MSFEVTLVVHAVVTWFLCGIAWTMQLTLPAGSHRFGLHPRLQWLVGGAMLFELFSAIALLIYAEGPKPAAMARINLMLLAMIWMANLLLKRNWIPTIAWTLRSFLLFLILTATVIR